MEKLTLALISLVLALSLLLRKKTDRINLPFVLICFFVFLYRGGSFLFDLSPGLYPNLIRFAGLVGLGPALVLFMNYLAQGEAIRTKRILPITSLISFLSFALFFARPGLRELLFPIMETLLAMAMAYILLRVLYHLRLKPEGAEKKRLEYQATALALTITIGCLDLIIGQSQRYVTDLAFAGLMYFTWMIIVYPQLTKLYELMARAAGIVVMSFLAAMTIIIFAELFSNGASPLFTQVFIASLIVVISIPTLRLLLERIFAYIYPEGKDIFTSFYELDRRLEREKAHLLEEMAPVLAHEIRNPLGSIKGAAQYLKADALPQQQGLLQVIIDETDRLNRVVSQFINYAKPYEIKPAEQDIIVILNRAITLIEANTNNEKIAIRKEIHSQLPLVKVDAEQVIQVLLNIGLNAVDAMPDHGVLSFRTLLSKNADGSDKVGIAIGDTGEGISRENIKNIFNPFFTTKKRGVGLGLAICQQIIRKHGGNIEVKSLAGQGTVFLIWFKV